MNAKNFEANITHYINNNGIYALINQESEVYQIPSKTSKLIHHELVLSISIKSVIAIIIIFL